jgi:hypothetical protein
MAIEMNEVKIKFSKFKIILLELGALLLVAGSIWLLLITNSQSSVNPAYMRLIAITGIVLFGAGAIYELKQLFDKKPGLVINKDGIWDNTSAISGCFILWTDIEKLEILKDKSNQYLLIHVKNPEEYIKKGSNGYKRFMLKMNNKTYGTPLSISSSSLQIKFDDLVTMINSRYQSKNK